eukprot:2965246-Amphidinium_carterae.2
MRTWTNSDNDYVLTSLHFDNAALPNLSKARGLDNSYWHNFDEQHSQAQLMSQGGVLDTLATTAIGSSTMLMHKQRCTMKASTLRL